MKTLADITAGLPVLARGGPQERVIKGIAYDSRRVAPGDLFVAIPGSNFDGHDFIPQAAAQGAAAVVVEKEVALPPGLAWARVQDSRQSLGHLAAAFYDYPARRLRLIGVTGTNGKTTVTHLIYYGLTGAGVRAALVGTLGSRWGETYRHLDRTTPEAADLQEILAAAVAAGVRAAVMEASSHALKLYRLEGCEFDGGVFTNLTQDHLDFHHDLDAYRRAKGRLFAGLGQGVKPGRKYAVLNADDPAWAYMAGLTKADIITYGIQQEAGVRGRNISSGPTGTRLEVVTPDGRYPLQLQLVGMFNVYNALAAWAVLRQEGVDEETIGNALAGVRGVPGRFELVRCGQPFLVVVDYAHTPDGLENVLHAARDLTAGRVITVFGCGGNRDRGKRPLMGEIASRRSDFTLVTSDNPRHEDPLAIIKEIMPGVEAGGGSFSIEPDRARAIQEAIKMAAPGDLVLIAGKGHETYQIIGDRQLPFDDREAACRVLQEMGYGAVDD